MEERERGFSTFFSGANESLKRDEPSYPRKFRHTPVKREPLQSTNNIIRTSPQICKPQRSISPKISDYVENRNITTVQRRNWKRGERITIKTDNGSKRFASPKKHLNVDLFKQPSIFVNEEDNK